MNLVHIFILNGENVIHAQKNADLHRRLRSKW
jgi:hypothetical protein